MAAALDNNEVAVAQREQREDECSNQIDYGGGEWALNKTTRGGGGRCETSVWRTMRGDLVASNARRSGVG